MSWNITDGDIYVSKSGDDATGDGSMTNPYKTIQKAVDEAVSGDKIVVGSGVYEEAVLIDNLSLTSLELVADGYVVVDGGNTRSYGICAYFWASGYNCHITIDGFILKKQTDYSIKSIGVSVYTTVQNCWCLDKVIDFTRGQSSGAHLVKNTLALGGLRYSQMYLGCKIRIENCTIFDVFRIPNEAGYAGSTQFSMKNTYIDCDGYYPPLDNWIDITDYNNIRGSIEVDGDTLYSSLEDFQLNSSTNFLKDSIDEEPHFNDDYTLKPESPHFGAGENGGVIGHTTKAATYIEVGHDILTNATLDNIVLTQAGKWEIDDPVSQQWGKITTDVLDLGNSQQLGKLNFDVEESYPDEVLDYDNTDVNPNRPTIRFRCSDTAFSKDDPTPAWIEVERNADLSSYTARYVQFEITLRVDGVEA